MENFCLKCKFFAHGYDCKAFGIKRNYIYNNVTYCKSCRDIRSDCRECKYYIKAFWLKRIINLIIKV